LPRPRFPSHLRSLNGKNILHVSLNDPIDKIRLTYKSTFQGIADKVENPDPNDTHKFWERMQHQQFIINVKKEGFAASRIEDQLKGLKGQDVALPVMVLIDGMDFEVPQRETLDELKKLAEAYDLAVWFTVRTHRHEEPDERGLPVQLSGIDDLFHRAIWIRPDDTGIHVDTIIGDVKGEKSLLLDPETMVIK
ncbi:MAG: hypothetical protein MI919_12805, partial [Holophagales bacterium]|nr:hypothetical protein [Holophagales bacterium]